MTDTARNNLAHEMLLAEFPDSQVKQFNKAKRGEPPLWLSYVPDETVMERLDTVFGPGGWTVNVAPTPTPGVALVTLSVRWPDNAEWITYSDFGYPTNGDRGEALKEAAGDGIRRCARYLGIARYIYAGDLPATPPASTARTPPASTARTRPAAPSSGAGSAPPDDDFDMDEVDRESSEDAECGYHHVKWWKHPENGTRMHQDGVWPDSGKKKWCIHRDDRNRPRNG